MRYHALATDYDGTLATDGQVDPTTLEALERLRASGRKLILVTGRELDDLKRVFARLDLFERVVAENGAVVYRPATREELPLAERPPDHFVEELRRRGVPRISVGRSIVATWTPHEVTVLKTIRDLGLELQVIFNKGAVMVLPSGVNKATGLAAALDEIGLSPHNVVAVGDAENDQAFLRLCECSVAVANALTAVKDQADLVTGGPRGAGVVEVVDRLVHSDLAELEDRLARHEIVLGLRVDDSEVRLKPFGTSLLITGTSGGGKSTTATGLLERLVEKQYQFCLIDPEGDYLEFEGAVLLGSAERAPTPEEVVKVLEQPKQNTVVNLLGVGIDERPAYMDKLLPALAQKRLRTGCPHWIVVDEAHYVMPLFRAPTVRPVAETLRGTMLITAFPDRMAREVVAAMAQVVVTGKSPHELVNQIGALLDQGPPMVPPRPAEGDYDLLWPLRAKAEPFWYRRVPPKALHRRHIRKYAEGVMAPDASFYFRGPEGKLNLRAHNLMLFVQMAEGVDDDTWMFHLRRGDYSGWFRESIGDGELADKTRAVETAKGVSPKKSRRMIKELIEERYAGVA